MPLRDVEEFHRWIERESPSLTAQRVARHFLADIGDEAWRSPSVPVEVLSNQPEYEVREVALPVEGEDRPVSRADVAHLILAVSGASAQPPGQSLQRTRGDGRTNTSR